VPLASQAESAGLTGRPARGRPPDHVQHAGGTRSGRPRRPERCIVSGAATIILRWRAPLGGRYQQPGGAEQGILGRCTPRSGQIAPDALAWDLTEYMNRAWGFNIPEGQAAIRGIDLIARNLPRAGCVPKNRSCLRPDSEGAGQGKAWRRSGGKNGRQGGNR